jgi:predicted RNase H-like HicB family nuclease
MEFVTTLDRDEDGVWVAESLSIPVCVSQGKTHTYLADPRGDQARPPH